MSLISIQVAADKVLPNGIKPRYDPILKQLLSEVLDRILVKCRVAQEDLMVRDVPFVAPFG